jgi:DNA-binding beta-propeller fold protein YncE
MTRLGVLALVVAAACGPAATTATPPSATQTGVAARPATPTPINVDDMMGGSLSPATVFAQVGNEIVAVKLQNHFVPYRIPVSGKPHAVVSPDGSRLYVADRKDGRIRLRTFDASSGVEVTSATLGDEPLAPGLALSQDRPDRLLLLVEAGTGVRVDAVPASLASAAVGVFKSQCGDQLLASATRIAIVCGSALSVAGVGEGSAFRSVTGTLSVPAGPISASAMLADGTIVLGTGSGKLHLIRGDAAALVPGPEIVGGTIVAIAPAGDDRYVVFARSETRSSAMMYDARSGRLSGGPFPLTGQVRHGVALWPFAYFAGSEPGLWHVDLRSGNVERMTPLSGPVPIAVSAR